MFVGYGVVAPEYNWNDYAGVDVKGKTVVILINDPGNEDANPDPKFFKGKAMTYYGRWTYKYEEAARQGAAAAIIVHETIPAAYGYQVVRNSNSGKKFWLDAADNDKSMVPVEGWMSLDTAKDLFKRAGLDYEQEKAAANKPGFKPVPMAGETLSVDAHSAIEHLEDAQRRGRDPGHEASEGRNVPLFGALGSFRDARKARPAPTRSSTAPSDNGMPGTSMVLELAEKFAHEKLATAFGVGFLFWTMEEQGLLGSEYFAEHPVWPRDHIVGLLEHRRRRS